MKCNLIILVLIAVLIIPICAQAINMDALIQEHQELIEKGEALVNQFKANEAKLAQLDKRTDDLKWVQTQIDKQKSTWLAEDVELAQAFNAHQAEVYVHNSTCVGEFEDENYVNECNRKADIINARASELNSKGEYHEQTRQKINEMIQTQTEETMKVFSETKDLNYKQQQIEIEVDRIKARLSEISVYVNDCKNAIESGDEEMMKSKCGEMFDGN